MVLSSLTFFFSQLDIYWKADKVSMVLRKQKNFNTLCKNKQKWCCMRKIFTCSICSKTMKLPWVIIAWNRVYSLCGEFWSTHQHSPFKKSNQKHCCFLSWSLSSYPYNVLHFVGRKNRKVLKIAYSKPLNILILRIWSKYFKKLLGFGIKCIKYIREVLPGPTMGIWFQHSLSFRKTSQTSKHFFASHQATPVREQT